MRTRATLVAVLAALACGAAGLFAATWRVPEPWLDGPYRTAIYPAMQRGGTSLSNAIPLAGADVVLVALLVALGYGIVRARRERDRRAAFVRLVLYAGAAAGALVFCFYAFWGVWYSRPSVTARIDYDPARVNATTLAELAERTEREINAIAPLAHADPLDGAALRAAIIPSYESTIVSLGAPGSILVSRTKRSIFDPYMTATGITGFMDPFGWDVVIDSRLTRWERPFTIAHEWTHLAGFASETEANFSAAIACTTAADPIVRYSGWINIYDVLPENTRKTMHLSPLVIADLTDIYERFQHDIKKPIFTFQWNSYDRYLKANHVANGIVSYNEMASLLLGTRFGPNGLPLPRKR
jgi:hypothetical protein